ncbi:MAG: N-methyl-D-aspartate receptor NMDAR2C subunit [Myxococcota bacterium]
MPASSRWPALWTRLGLEPPAVLLEELVTRYRAPHRAYHTLRHLEECFVALDAAAPVAERPAEIEIALWFHDAVYDTRTSDSEERSARWASRALRAVGAPTALATRVEGLVLATKHDGPAASPDARLLVDVDLSILGASEERFDEYERQVRQEYAWVPEDAFREARRRILSGFLARPRLFGTDWFADRLERRARTNLARSIRSLSP